MDIAGFINLELRLENLITNTFDQYIKMINAIVDLSLTNEERNKSMKKLFSDQTDALLLQLKTEFGEVIKKLYNVKPNKERYGEEMGSISFVHEKGIIKFTVRQSYLIRLIFNKNKFIDRDLYLLKCSEILAKRGNIALTRSLMGYWNKIKHINTEF